MKKTVIMFCLSFIFLAVGIFLILNPSANIGKDKTKKILTTKNIDPKICKVKQCFANYMGIYYTLSADTKNKELKKTIDNINNETIKQKNKTLKSNLNDASCSNVRKKYNYSYISNMNMQIYENDKYLSIAIQRENNNLCTNKSITSKPEVYIYSKEKEKIISQDEFKKEQNIDMNIVYANIAVSIGNYNERNNTQYTYEKIASNENKYIKFFYNSLGKINIYYYQPENNTYYISEIS